MQNNDRTILIPTEHGDINISPRTAALLPLMNCRDAGFDARLRIPLVAYEAASQRRATVLSAVMYDRTKEQLPAMTMDMYSRSADT